jgi:hypothetical protein
MSVERQGRSVRALGLGDIIYKHGWLVKKGKGHIHLYQPNSAGFGTLIKERMGLQPTDRGCKAGHAAGHDRGRATLAYTSVRCGGKQGFVTPSRDLSEKRNSAQRGKDQAQNVP